MDLTFRILCVRENDPIKYNGEKTKNQYMVDVETAFGVFPVAIRRATGKVHSTIPLSVHPKKSDIEKAVKDLIAELELKGEIGLDGQREFELAKPSQGSLEKTEIMKTKIRELNSFEGKKSMP